MQMATTCISRRVASRRRRPLPLLMLVCTPLAMCSSAISDCAASPNNTLMTMLMSLSADTDAQEEFIACGAILGLQDANDRNGRIVPQLGTLPADAPYIHPLPLGVASSNKLTIEGYRTGRAAGSEAMLAPPYSANSLEVASLGAVDDVALISYWASIPALSKPEYATFSRTFPSELMPTHLVASWMHQQGWTYFTILHDSTAFANSYASALAHEAPGNGLIVVATVSYDADSNDDSESGSVALALDQITQTPPNLPVPANIIVWVDSMGNDTLVITQALRRGLFEAGRVWIVTDVIGPRTVTSRMTGAGLDPRKLEGMRSLYFSPIMQPGYLRTAEVVKTLKSSDCANDLFQVTDDEISQNRNDPIFSYAYDAAVALALAMKVRSAPNAAWANTAWVRAVREDPNTSLTTVLQGLEFDGASGHVAFYGDAAKTTPYGPGDRRLGELDLVIFQWVWGEDVASLVEQPLEAIDNSSETPTPFPGGAPPRWLGGISGVVPEDAIDASLRRAAAADKKQKEVFSIVVITVSSVLGLLLPTICGYAGWRWYLHRKRELAIKREYHRSLEAKIAAAIASTKEFDHAEVLLNAREFIRLGRLASHEELRDRGLLILHDKLDELTRAPHHIIFFSHQWTSRSAPDHTGVQYETMVAAIGRVTRANSWDLDRVWVWVDVSRWRANQQPPLPPLTARSAVPRVLTVAASSPVSAVFMHPAAEPRNAEARDRLVGGLLFGRARFRDRCTARAVQGDGSPL